MSTRRTTSTDRHVTSRLLARYTLSLLDHSEGLAVALSEGNVDRICHLSHRLKGSAGGYGFRSISDLAAVIEQEALEIEADVSLITDRVEELIRQCRDPRRDADGAFDVNHQ